MWVQMVVSLYVTETTTIYRSLEMVVGCTLQSLHRIIMCEILQQSLKHGVVNSISVLYSYITSTEFHPCYQMAPNNSKKRHLFLAALLQKSYKTDLILSTLKTSFLSNARRYHSHNCALPEQVVVELKNIFQQFYFYHII